MSKPESVKPYNPEESKKEQVSSMFDKIAPYYDLLNRVLSLGIDIRWRKKAIRELQSIQPQTILDVATGTADLAMEAKRQLKSPTIIGLDISAEMLSIGRKKIAQKGWDQAIQLQEGDSENLPFEDNTFDAITVAFGVRNFENLAKGLSEMRRVLKPDGKIVVLEFSRPTLFPFKQIYNAYFKYLLPLIGRLTSKDPHAYRYLYESVQAFPDGPQFIQKLEEVGYKQNKCKRLTLGVCSIYTGIK